MFSQSRTNRRSIAMQRFTIAEAKTSMRFRNFEIRICDRPSYTPKKTHLKCCSCFLIEKLSDHQTSCSLRGIRREALLELLCVFQPAFQNRRIKRFPAAHLRRNLPYKKVCYFKGKPLLRQFILAPQKNNSHRHLLQILPAQNQDIIQYLREKMI